MESIFFAVHGEPLKTLIGWFRIIYEVIFAGRYKNRTNNKDISRNKVSVADIYMMFIAVAYALKIREHHDEEYYHHVHGDITGVNSRDFYGF